MSYDPVEDVVARGIMVGITDVLPEQTDAWWIQDEQVIVLARHLSEVQRREMIAHMLAHLELKHSPIPRLLDKLGNRTQQREVAAGRRTARLLIGLRDLIWTMVNVSTDAAVISQHLDVTVTVLAKRIRNLRDSELQELRAATRAPIVWPSSDPFASPLRCSITASLLATAPTVEDVEILRAG